MAYADKLISMKPFTIISRSNGDILVEGVAIEGHFLASDISTSFNQVIQGTLEELYEYAANKGILVMLGDKDKIWEPRVHTEEMKEYGDSTDDEYPELRQHLAMGANRTTHGL